AIELPPSAPRAPLPSPPLPRPPLPLPPAPPAPPLALPQLRAALPMSCTLTPETLPLSVVSATAVLVLKELLRLVDAVPPLLAAAVPMPSARARPRLSRLLPMLLSLLSELSSRSTSMATWRFWPGPFSVLVACANACPVSPSPTKTADAIRVFRMHMICSPCVSLQRPGDGVKK
ncbi:hypothetical protein FKV25_14290, partial [Lysobacter aestuarii]